MEQFPGNSHSARRPAKDEPKQVERVVSSRVVRRKKPLSRRFAETFLGGDAQSVGSYVILDVLIPAFKDMVADAMSTGVERMLYGERRSIHRRGSHIASQYGHTPYSRYSTGGPRPEDPRSPSMSRRARQNHDFDEILLASRAEADEVLGRLYFLVDKYDAATVKDLYELVGITPEYTDRKWGWVDLQGTGVRRTREGYLLELPRPEPLE